MGLFWFIGVLFSENVRHNRRLYKLGVADKSRVRRVTVGWRRDPIYENDGYEYELREPDGDETGEWRKDENTVF